MMKRPLLSFFITLSVFLCGVAFILIGVLRGEPLAVFQKAIRICLECIGVG